jgi:N-acetylmuramoyl-L-alanine amidase
MPSPRREDGDALRCGDRSAAVTEIRAALAALGLLDDTDDDLTTGRHVALELFDSELDQAVRAFQQHRGLLVDGIVGEATYRALKEASYRLGARTLYHQFGAPLYGDDVATLQARLQDLGFYTGLVDGHFGLQTHNALMSYQREYGLSADGIWWLTSRDSRRRAGPPIGPQTVRQADHYRPGPRRRRPRFDRAGPDRPH